MVATIGGQSKCRTKPTCPFCPPLIAGQEGQSIKKDGVCIQGTKGNIKKESLDILVQYYLA